MNLLAKILLWMFPVGLPVIGFTWSYYHLQMEATVEQISNMGSLAADAGARQINDYLHLRVNEFTLLRSALDQCEKLNDKRYELVARDALAKSQGFSALVVTDKLGIVRFNRIAAKDSNRFVLPYSLKNTQFFPADKFRSLVDGYNQWQQRLPQLRKTKSNLFMEAISLEQRGEINSVRYQNLQNQIFNLTSLAASPPVQIHFTGGAEAQAMGLPFQQDTFVFSVPLQNCEGELAGFASALLDRTQLEDILFGVRKSLMERNLSRVDVALLRSEPIRFETQTRYLAWMAGHVLDQLMQSPEGAIQVKQGFFAQTAVADAKTLSTLLNQNGDGHDQSGDKDYLRIIDERSHFHLMIFIDAEEWHSVGRELLKQVFFWLSLSMLLLFVLVFFLARSLVTPIIRLKRTIALVEAGDLNAQADVRSADEVGQLARAFNRMTQTLQQSEELLKRLATQDDLTGLLNRRALTEDAIRERHRASRSGEPISIAMLDLDHFKDINDMHGHSAGDVVLKQFAKRLNRQLRRTDYISRIGGEEFVVLLPGTDRQTAHQLLEKLLEYMNAQPVELENGAMLEIRFSAGVVLWSSEFGFEEILHQADKKLYQAKQQGRNRVMS
ncbi:MAG: diguanylate cyclase [Amphritea sp.]|nr:diguanylate cyclase [Amphritea sp.]